MKKIISIVVFAIIHFSLLAQAPILDSANIVHRDGDTVFYWDGNINYFAPGNAGANVLWDFSNINFTIPISNPSELYLSYISSNSSMYLPNLIERQDALYNAPYCLKRFYYASSYDLSYSGDELDAYCSSSSSIWGHNLIPKKFFLKFPFTYLSAFSDSSFYESANYYPTIYSSFSKNKYSVIADGWGSLQILNITHPSVLRVREINQNFDSAGIILKSIDTTYKWYEPNTFEALMTMTTTWRDSSGVWINTQNCNITPYGIEYNTNFVNINENRFSNNLLAFPNPATTQATITYPNPTTQGQLQIYNMLGEIVYEENLNKNATQTIINTKEYKKGLYKVVLREKGEIKGQASLVIVNC